MKLRRAMAIVLLAIHSAAGAEEESLPLVDEAGGWRAAIDAKAGFVRSLEFRRDGQWSAIQFRSDAFAGPRWNGVALVLKDAKTLTFEGRTNRVVYALRYQSVGGKFAVIASLHNDGPDTFAPKHARLMMGLDTEMVRFPQWNDVLFPTLLRCEPTHFWGYCMGPTGRILGIASPDAVASYNLEYNQTGHRIFTCDLDLLHQLPLPARHPQKLSELKPGERKSWTIVLEDIGSLDELKPRLAATARAPMIEAERYTLAAGEQTSVTVWSVEKPELYFVRAAAGTNGRVSEFPFELKPRGAGVWQAEFAPKAGPGVYTLAATAGGKRSEATVYVRKPWSWYLQRARAEALNKPQKASTHRESWVGCFSAYLAHRYFPDRTLDAAAEKMFRDLFVLMYDPQKAEPLPPSDPRRSQNHSVMVSLLTTIYATTGDTNDLDFAARLVDWLIANRQADDGSFRARSKTGVHYTSVHYMAKNVLELAAQEKTLAANSDLWRERYQRHFESARRAIDDLLQRGDRVETEGEQTLEDSMIANTASQLALFALMQSDPAKREAYRKAAEFMHDKHRCLSQLVIPDCRMRGGTLRFWESQYDVLMKPNMMNSPHGWTARKTPGTWYLYLLTGEERYLRETMDAVGACMQLIDVNSGELRWAFVPDPYVEANAFESDPKQSGHGLQVKRVVGEQYIPMISGWWQAPPGQAVRGYSTSIPGSCCDNDVHEVFKAMVEIALTAAYVLERPDGEIVAWNCTFRSDQGVLVIEPAEKVVNRVHLNLKHKRAVRAEFEGVPAVTGEFAGMSWIGPGGVPELLRCGN